ncbi:MAG TPA: type I restriction-modification system endonuclease, partial [Allocoleopsis sp.]
MVTLAEQYFQTDPITCLMKLRQFGESLAQLIAAENGIYTDDTEDQFKLINRLREYNIISDKVEDLFNAIRKAGNKATHNQKGDHDVALQTLKYARSLGVWYYRVITKNKTFKLGAFIPPNNPVDQTEELKQELSKLREEAEKSRSEAELAQFKVLQEQQLREIAEQLLIETEKEKEEFAQQLKEIQNQNQVNSSALIKEIIPFSQEAENEIELDEYDTRFLIDNQLIECGWEVNSRYLTYGKGTRPTKGKNYAIAQYPVNDGVADYALFCGLQIVGIIEAKRQSQDVSSDLEQAKRYSESFQIKQNEILPNGSPYNNYYIPFVFATNGREYLRQLHTKSGIWFCDLRQSNNLARPLQNWYSPSGLLALLKIDIVTSHQQLEQESFNYNFDLRYYQKEAIKAVELALFQQKREILLAMATGTGKTKTALILIYRLLKNKRFNRVLFLVDRTALGEQTANVFKDEKIDRLESFANIFGLRDLESNDSDNSNIKVHIATVQSFMEKIFFPSDKNPRPPIDEYDGIFVDECHRGYILDDELTEIELSYKDLNNYISKYTRVLDYFDAVKVGLTATPALHTTKIFGDPIYHYTYRQAVIDGYLIDHEPPIILTTKLAQEGISWEQGEEIEIFEQNTGEIDLIHAPDQIKINIDNFHSQVITESFNMVICRELVNHINPNLPGKTLIFCVNNNHADLVVNLLKEALNEKYGNIDDNTVMKITGKVDQPLQKIRLYKNEANPKIAVTVDL